VKKWVGVGCRCCQIPAVKVSVIDQFQIGSQLKDEQADTALPMIMLM